jgi:hypothetical protein
MLDPFNTNPQFSGRIVHLEATSNFKLAGKRFATEMIERQILVRYWRRERQELLTLMKSASGISVFSQSLGHLNELWWHVAMQEGGPVQLVRLKDKPARNASNTKYESGSIRKVNIPTTASRYSAKQNLGVIKSLWDIDKTRMAYISTFSRATSQSWIPS